jgi:hypothetical protein
MNILRRIEEFLKEINEINKDGQNLIINNEPNVYYYQIDPLKCFLVFKLNFQYLWIELQKNVSEKVTANNKFGIQFSNVVVHVNA